MPLSFTHQTSTDGILWQSRHNPRNLNLANTSAQIRASNSRGPPIAEFAFRGHTIIPPSSTQYKTAIHHELSMLVPYWCTPYTLH